MISSENYRKEIDGIRAFAVIAVIINHFNYKLLPSGYLGVDIFFVISGFVITSSLANRESKGFWDFICSFYARRLKRLVPALAFFVIICGILICLVNPYPGVSLFTGITSLFGVSNIYLWRESTDYFAESTQLNIFTHTWSLGVEEQFYLIFPFLIWFSGFLRQTRNGKRNFIYLICFLSIISLSLFIYYSLNHVSTSYFLMPCRFWEMASGSLFYFLSRRNQKSNIEFFKINPNFVAILILPILFLPTSTNLIATLLIVFLTNFLILNIRKDFLVYKLFTQNYIVYVGLISYSLYLWHWGILSLATWTIGINKWSVLIQILLIFLLSIFSYKYIEQPLRNSIWLKKKYLSLFFGASIISISALFLIILGKPLKEGLAKINKKINPAAYEYYPTSTEGLKCNFPSKIKNALVDCLKIEVNSDNKGNIYLIGDSHAANHYFSIKNNLPTNQFSEIRSILEWGLIHSLEGDKCINSPCIKNSWDKYLYFFENNLTSKDIVIFSWARDRIVKDRKAKLVREPDQKKLQILQTKLIEIIEIIRKNKSKLILVDDIPKVCPGSINFRQDIIVRGNIKKCVIKKSISLQDREPLSIIYKNLSEKNDSINYFDPHDYLCQDDGCDLFDEEGNMLYSDESPHFSANNPAPLIKAWNYYLKKI